MRDLFGTDPLPQGSAPLSRRACIVAPSSLVNNWSAEFRKWLGDARLKPLVGQSCITLAAIACPSPSLLPAVLFPSHPPPPVLWGFVCPVVTAMPPSR